MLSTIQRFQRRSPGGPRRWSRFR